MDAFFRIKQAYFYHLMKIITIFASSPRLEKFCFNVTQRLAPLYSCKNPTINNINSKTVNYLHGYYITSSLIIKKKYKQSRQYCSFVLEWIRSRGFLNLISWNEFITKERNYTETKTVSAQLFKNISYFHANNDSTESRIASYSTRSRANRSASRCVSRIASSLLTNKKTMEHST